jgi:serine/threonine protein kinase
MTKCFKCGTLVPEDARACLKCGTPHVDHAAAKTVAMSGEVPAYNDLLGIVRRELQHDYDVQKELGRGGMAVVYKATEIELLRPVALKVLPPEMSVHSSMAERFKREARMAAQLDHPNIIPVYRVGQSGRVFYIAMKFIEGRGLDTVVESQGALPLAVVLHVLRSATSALAFAHSNRIVHRDIKGANILIDQDGRVVVSDFGIARAVEDAGLTATGAVIGTPYFMSPEQCAGHRVGAQSDQYSLGVVAFQMLTGSVPFKAETLPGVMQHHFFTPVPDITAVRPDVPQGLLDVVNRALAKRPVDRYPTTQEMLAAVESIPFTDADRRQGEQQLRDLVLGASVPEIATNTLPPLIETIRMTPPNVTRLRQAAARRRSGITGVAIGIAAAVLVVTGASWFAARSVAPSAPDSLSPELPAAAIAAAPARPVARRGTAASEPARAGEPATGRTGAAGASRRGATDSASLTAGGASAARGTASARVPSVASASSLTDADGSARTVSDSGAARAHTLDTLPDDAARRDAGAAAGKLRVRVYPTDAEIIVDNRSIGRGVVIDSLVPTGTRLLRIKAPGYVTFDTTFVIRSGEITQLGRISLRTADGSP